jgi:hypothetical protein
MLGVVYIGHYYREVGRDLEGTIVCKVWSIIGIITERYEGIWNETIISTLRVDYNRHY